jgi:hypothetical protein
MLRKRIGERLRELLRRLRGTENNDSRRKYMLVSCPPSGKQNSTVFERAPVKDASRGV